METTTADILARIANDLAAGRTVCAATALKVFVFAPQNVKMLRAHGVEPFKIGTDGSLRMFEGWTKRAPRFVRISTSEGALLVRLTASD